MSTREKLVEQLRAPGTWARHAEHFVASSAEETLTRDDAPFHAADTLEAQAARIAVLEAERNKFRSLVELAHPTMIACGWHLAMAAEPQGDGVLEAACTEIEEKFSEAVHAARNGK